MFSASSLIALRHELNIHSRPLVVALCAQWCGTCREFTATFYQLETQFPQAAFFWLDIEDDTSLCEEIDVHDFPVLAIYNEHGIPCYFGTSSPQKAVIARLLKETLGSSVSTSILSVAPEAKLLYQKLLTVPIN